MAAAKIHTTKESDGKGRKPRRKEKDYTIEISGIKDDGVNLMRVAKSRTVSKGLPFGRFKIADTTTVELCCNQDPKTAAIANRACRQLVRKFMNADMAESGEILEAVAKAIQEEEGEY
jgi:hypothetical protein